MPTGNAIADGMTRSADMRGEASVQDILSNGFVSDTPITPTLDPNSFVKQSRDILSSGLNNPAIPQLFGKVERSGQNAIDSLDIIDEQYRQEELKKLPLDMLQGEVDDLQARRARVLPELLSDSGLLDFNAKLRLASMTQSMFDREIDKTLNKKKSLEDAAASRAKMRADTARSRAQMYDKQAQQDQYMLTKALDLFTAGSGSLQDILEVAVQMEEHNAKRKAAGAGKDSNPYIGTPGQDFTDEEVAAFLKADRNFGKLELSDSVGTQYKLRMNARYKEWADSGRPVRSAGTKELPEGVSGPVQMIMQILSATTDKNKAGEDGYYLNPFPQSPSTDIFSRYGIDPTASAGASNEE